MLQLQDRRSTSGSLPSSAAEKERDSDLSSDQDKAKDCNGQVVPKVVLERSATVIEVRARLSLLSLEDAHPDGGTGGSLGGGTGL